jgi:hypothetical protein
MPASLRHRSRPRSLPFIRLPFYNGFRGGSIHQGIGTADLQLLPTRLVSRTQRHCLSTTKRADSRDCGPSTAQRSCRTRHGSGSGLLRPDDRRRDRVRCLCLVLAPMIWLASAGLALIIAAFLLRWWAQRTAAALELSGEVLYSDGDTTADVSSV